MTETLDSFLKKVDICPLVPVLTIENLHTAGDLALALEEAGLTIIEVTLRTDVALDAIRKMKKAAPALSVGVGTILNKADIHAALDTGCDFLVTPATTNRLLNDLEVVQIPVFPGVATPGEALRAFEFGFRFQKFFPAESSGGVKALKSITAPMPGIKFMPTGGINGSTVQDYLSCSNVVAVGGSWMLDNNAVANRDWKAVVKHTRSAINAISQ